MVVISLDSPSCGVCLFDPRTGSCIGMLPDRRRIVPFDVRLIWCCLYGDGLRTWAGIIQVVLPQSGGRRFIRCWRESSAVAWRHYSDALHRCPSDHPVLKTLLQHTRHALWYILRWLLRHSILAPLDHPVPLGLPHMASHQCSKLHRCQCVGLSSANRIHQCLGVGSSGAYWKYRTHPFHPLFEFFLRVLLCLSFLLHSWDL